MSRHDEDLTDVLLENKLLFEQLNELKASERQHLNEVAIFSLYPTKEVAVTVEYLDANGFSLISA